MSTGEPTSSGKVEYVSVADWNAATDRAIKGHSVTDDPRCLYGWGPPARDCYHLFGHLCGRFYRHPGRCMVDVEDRLPCESTQRPKDWDDKQRKECNS